MIYESTCTVFYNDTIATSVLFKALTPLGKRPYSTLLFIYKWEDLFVDPNHLEN